MPITSGAILKNLCRDPLAINLANSYLFVLNKWNRGDLPAKIEHVCAYLASEQ